MLSPEGAVLGRGWKQVSQGGNRSRAKLADHARDAGKALLSIYSTDAAEHPLHHGDTEMRLTQTPAVAEVAFS